MDWENDILHLLGVEGVGCTMDSELMQYTIVLSWWSGYYRFESHLRWDIFCFKTSWWRHQMETFSALLAICAGNSPVTGEFPAQRPVTRSFDVFLDLRLNKPLSKQWWGWWFETLSRPLWRHGNVFRKNSRSSDWCCCQCTGDISHFNSMTSDPTGSFKCFWITTILQSKSCYIAF